MWRNAALYLARESPDLFRLLPDAEALGTPVHTWLFDLEGATLFNVMPADEMPEHLRGFAAYLETRRPVDGAAAVESALEHVRRCRAVLGLVVVQGFESVSHTWDLLCAIATEFEGVIFIGDSVVHPGGAILCGPLLHEE